MHGRHHRKNCFGFPWRAGADESTGRESRGVNRGCVIQCPMPLPLHILQLLLSHPKIVPQFMYESLANLMTNFRLACADRFDVLLVKHDVGRPTEKSKTLFLVVGTP
jgi:hypothetical protein